MSDKPELRLPGASISHPTCGACGETTDYEDGEFYCGGCRLTYSGDDPESPGWYRDDEDEPCGHDSGEKPYAKESEKYPGTWYMFTKYPCPLPKGHKDTGYWWENGHHYPTDAKECPKPDDADTPEGLRV